MEHQHPEMLNQPLGAAQLNTYGMRQHIDSDLPAYRFDAERLVRHLVARYHDNPAGIGWQIDNEISSYGTANDDFISRDSFASFGSAKIR
jgi:beta-galactosidase